MVLYVSFKGDLHKREGARACEQENERAHVPTLLVLVLVVYPNIRNAAVSGRDFRLQLSSHALNRTYALRVTNKAHPPRCWVQENRAQR